MKQNVLRKLPASAGERKEIPIAEGVIDFFPLALAAIARCSNRATSQHHPGEPMHWDRGKSSDHVNCIIRHLIERDEVDSDGIPHIHKLAWRALAASQEYEERQAGWTPVKTISIEEAEANRPGRLIPVIPKPGQSPREAMEEAIADALHEPEQMRLWNEAA